MAGAEEEDEVEEVEEVETAGHRSAEQAKGLDRMGNGGGDGEGAERQVDGAKVDKAFKLISEESKVEREAEAARLKELAKVKINAADVMLIVAEVEVDKKAAEMRLRENGGDVVAALRSYVQADKRGE
eukprot:CAMPEP_0197588662 /NCGR_PEP_ID=MMETSP1326-20131121/9863_1 /TAXON_ID=1155430 /ORGANISM="Genus nov. species nov., Strain RCC2288" /LENGTH=127 /DNA_ID=CAMNT_0043153511 /DNA_START=174 /DNA_END=554 /DNA_ORIENTATION=-